MFPDESVGGGFHLTHRNDAVTNATGEMRRTQKKERMSKYKFISQVVSLMN